MAGGIYSSMNKVRPGAYINFESQIESRVELGSRGIATLAAPLSWGGEEKLIEVNSSDMTNGESLAKVGLMPNEKEALLLNLALKNCSKLQIFNVNKSGVKATITLEEGLVITAKYPGTFGNKIAILIKPAGKKFAVETYANGYFVDSQKVGAIEDLKSNDFVDFSGSGSLAQTASTLLKSGTDGTTPQASEYLPKYFNALRLAKWNTMALTTSGEEDKKSVATFIEEVRENDGKYVQAVIANYDTADYEGIINSVNGIVLEDGTNVTAEQFTAWVAGAIAGADIVESITGKVVEGATSVTGLLSNDEIVDALNAGKLVLSLNQNGDIKVEKDINSLHSFTQDKGYIFSKNRVIRELDEIGASIENIWESSYLGKVSNTEEGRTLFKSSIINYLSNLQNKGAIRDFDSKSVEVQAGKDIDVVVASIAVKPVDSMEFLYMTVNVDQ